MEQQVLKTIQEYQMFEPGNKCLIGVSGGADSIALLQILSELKDQLGLSLHVVHLNHLLRGAPADEDEEFVRNLARKHSLPITVERVDVENLAKLKGLGIEEAGREARYAFYYKTARDTGAQRIALAHSADDNIETFMMRLLRGAGLKGLLGIPPVRDKIVRPLILTWRRDIELYCAKHKLIPRVDYTNYESRYLRNRVRMKLIPQLKIFNPNVKELLLQTILMLTNDYYYIHDQALKSLKSMTETEEEDILGLNLVKLRKLDQTLQGHVLREAISDLKGDLKEVSFNHIQGIMDLLETTEAKKLDLPEDIKAVFERDTLTLRRGDTEVPPPVVFAYDLALPGEVKIQETGTTIAARHDELPSLSKLKEDNPKAAYVDANKLDGKVVVRNRRPGDRFSPLGLGGSKKLQDFFVDLKVNQSQRDLVPIVESEGKIVWVAGYRLDEAFKVTALTKKVIRLELR